MKKLCVLLSVHFLIIAASAQQQKPFPPQLPRHHPLIKQQANTKAEKVDHRGFTIQLLSDGTANREQSGFEIKKVGKTLTRIERSAMFFHRPMKKDDMLKAAKWVIREFEKTGRWMSHLPPHAMHQIEINSSNN